MASVARGRRRPAVQILALALLIGVAGEATLRLRRFGLAPAALGPWREAPPWDRLRTIDRAGEIEPIPGATAAWSLAPGEPVVRYHLNSLGLREDGEASPRPAPGVCRVLALGDAYTFGYGVAARDAYPRRLARRLARRGRFEVLNAGFPNLDVERQRRRLEALLPDLGAQVVVVSFSWWNVPPSRPPPEARPPRWSSAWWVENLEEKGERLGGHLALADVALRAARAAATPHLLPPSGLARELEPLALPPAALEERWARTRAALAAMAALARAAGARFLLVVTPLDLQVDPARNALYRSGRLPYAAHGFADVDYARAPTMPAALRRFAGEAGIPLVDTTPAFRAWHGVPLFLDADYHAAPAGHRLIARQVAGWIERTRPCAPAAGGSRGDGCVPGSGPARRLSADVGSAGPD